MNPDYITFVSADKTEFTLPTIAAKRSGFVSRILEASKYSPASLLAKQKSLQHLHHQQQQHTVNSNSAQQLKNSNAISSDPYAPPQRKNTEAPSHQQQTTNSFSSDGGNSNHTNNSFVASSSEDSSPLLNSNANNNNKESFSEKMKSQQQQQQLKTKTNFRLELPDIHSSVLDIICQFLHEAHCHQVKYEGREPPLDFSRALEYFDPNSAEDRTFVTELMLAADYLSC